MNKHKVKHHRNSDTKTSNRDHVKNTTLERSVMNYWGAQTSLTPATSPSVTDVVQTFSWLFGSLDHPLIVNESSRSTDKSSEITMKKQRRGLDRYNVLHYGWRSLVCQTTPLKI